MTSQPDFFTDDIHLLFCENRDLILSLGEEDNQKYYFYLAEDYDYAIEELLGYCDHFGCNLPDDKRQITSAAKNEYAIKEKTTLKILFDTYSEQNIWPPLFHNFVYEFTSQLFELALELNCIKELKWLADLGEEISLEQIADILTHEENCKDEELHLFFLNYVKYFNFCD